MKAVKYPKEFDDNDSLYVVYDSLRVPLAFDYFPGHTNIIADGDLSKFPASGIITLVDQYSSPKERNVSLYYGSRTNREFLDLELLSDSIDCIKPKKITIITLQAMANHREALKNSIIAIENFLGKKYETKGKTIFSRLNFLKKVLHSPKAWFEVDRTIGFTPFTANFVFTGIGNVGPVGDVIYKWKINDEEIETKETTLKKVFISPGNYTISLTVQNYYGEDTVTFNEMIKIKDQAPEIAAIKFLPLQNQIHINNKIRTPINQPVIVEMDNKTSHALIDPKTTDKVKSYTWNLNDDLPHANAHKTKAIYTVGGYYDLTLRTDTDLGSYRINTYEKAIDVVEPTNLWIWGVEDKQIIRSYEFGLVSEVLKTSKNTYTLKTNDKFLKDQRQIFEFWRNNGVVRKNDIKSGDGGDCLLFWASGRNLEDPISAEQINFASYNGFTDDYKVEHSIQRPWNWAALTSKEEIYFILGQPTTEHLPTISATNKSKISYDILTGDIFSDNLEYTNFKNDAHDLLTNPVFAAYRTTWKNSVGYILRNSSLGEYFSFQSFYKTEGTLGLPFKNIVKLPDMPGDGNKEGSLVALNNGIYFFNNHGGSYCFNDSNRTWELVNSHNKISRNELNSLLAASDSESKAYISIEDTAFFKFNEIDMSYVTFNHGLINKQWLMSIF